MAGLQLQRRTLDDIDAIDGWMARWNADATSLGPAADAAGRDLWAQSTLDGRNLPAARPYDVTALGARAMSGAYDQSDGSDDDPPGDVVSPIMPPDTDGLTTLGEALHGTRFATAAPGDSITDLIGGSDAASVGRFLTLNGMGARSSTILPGVVYVIPGSVDDASREELAAGRQLLAATTRARVWPIRVT